VPQCIAVAVSDDDDHKEVDDSGKEYFTVVERDFKC
jgi:hypothetical protein